MLQGVVYAQAQGRPQVRDGLDSRPEDGGEYDQQKQAERGLYRVEENLRYLLVQCYGVCDVHTGMIPVFCYGGITGMLRFRGVSGGGVPEILYCALST